MHVRSSMWLVTALGCASAAPEAVRPGVDVLLSDSLHLVTGRRVGILTNQTGIDARGVDDITRLRAAGVNLTTILSPEHGFRGTLDREDIGHGTDSATGLPIYSLYGATRAPSADMLANVDVLLIDLQDIGSRTYTYVSTALLSLRAATTAGIGVVVLDRPNPIGGSLVQGPVLDTAFASFVGMLPVPLRHGLTMGELVRFGMDVLAVDADLVVVPAAGWTREHWFDETALPWVQPSPNMPDLESATHYPGIVLFEHTNLSVGRGTPIAFQTVAAPWLDAPAVVAAVGDVAGVALADTTIQPRAPGDGKYPDAVLPAVRFSVRDRTAYDPVFLAVTLLATLRELHGDRLEISARGFDQRAGSDALRLALETGAGPDAIAAAWARGLETFRARRLPYLLY